MLDWRMPTDQGCCPYSRGTQTWSGHVRTWWRSAPILVGAATVGLLLALPASGQDTGPTGSTPGTACRAVDNPEPAQQGRVPTAVYDAGWTEPFTCNADLIASHNSTGGFKVHRYVDASGNECAYYDSTLVFPLDITTQLSEGAGVVVLDMTDSTDPVQTTTLTSPAMLSPHESLVLSEERGILAAVLGTAATFPGQVDLYDVSEDCRNPQLLSSAPVGFLGHESGLSPDGMTMYATSLFTSTIAAIDISDPTLPQTLYVGNFNSHGLTISADGNRAYLTPFKELDPALGPLDGLDGDFDGGLLVLDVSSIQAREPLPQPTIVSTLQWPDVSIPQVALPVTYDGVPHLMEIDEFTDGFDPLKLATFDNGNPGAARIISMADEKAPVVVSNIRLAVHDPEVRATDGILDDPGGSTLYKGYAGHYCQVDRIEDPQLLACSMIQSGLRVFDVRDPTAPVEIAYVNVPGQPGTPPFNPEGSAYAMSQPAFDLEQNEIWYSDTSSGFHVVRLAPEVFPFGAAVPDPDAAPSPVPTSANPAPAATPVATTAPVVAAAPTATRGPLPATGGGLAAFGLLTLVGAAVWRRR